MGGFDKLYDRLILASSFHIVRFFIRYFVDCKVIGEENIPHGNGVLFLSNHLSAFDVFLVPWAIYTKYPNECIRQAGKQELFSVPLIGWFLKKIGGFPIKRGSANISSIRSIEKYIRESRVVLYPEGTRSIDNKIQAGNRMVGRIIKATKPAVVPVLVKGTEKLIPVGKIFPRVGAKIEVHFGPPVNLEEEFLNPRVKESSTKIIEKVMQTISDLS
jgi:1-acyl-sn-glycerol-3-phosphate acyltransferase